MHIYGIGDFLYLSVLHLGTNSVFEFLVVRSVIIFLKGGSQSLLLDFSSYQSQGTFGCISLLVYITDHMVRLAIPPYIGW